MNNEEKANYEALLKKLGITQCMMDTARMEGEFLGRQEAKLEREIESLEYLTSVAIKLIKRGFSNEDIADITGLDMELVSGLRKSLMNRL